MSDGVHDARSTRRGHDGGESTTDRAEPLLRPEAVARLLSCSSKTVYAWAASGLIPSVRLGRLVRFRSVDVWRFIEAHAEARKGGVHGSGLS
jgi:excisionase family DNA binding protein